MNKIVLLSIYLSYSLFASEITVKVHNIKNNNGQISIGIFDKTKGFPKTKNALVGVTVNIRENFSIYTFKNLQNKEYAVAVFHDENNNGKLDRNFLGIPTEAYGFSNNTKALFGPPIFDKAKFFLKTDMTINIKLN